MRIHLLYLLIPSSKCFLISTSASCITGQIWSTTEIHTAKENEAFFTFLKEKKKSLLAAEVRGKGAEVLTTVNLCSEQDFALWICPKVPLLPSLGGTRRSSPLLGSSTAVCLGEHSKHSLNWAKARPWPSITTDNPAGGTLCQGEMCGERPGTAA